MQIYVLVHPLFTLPGKVPAPKATVLPEGYVLQKFLNHLGNNIPRHKVLTEISIVYEFYLEKLREFSLDPDTCLVMVTDVVNDEVSISEYLRQAGYNNDDYLTQALTVLFCELQGDLENEAINLFDDDKIELISGEPSKALAGVDAICERHDPEETFIVVFGETLISCVQEAADELASAFADVTINKEWCPC